MSDKRYVLKVDKLLLFCTNSATLMSLVNWFYSLFYHASYPLHLRPQVYYFIPEIQKYELYEAPIKMVDEGYIILYI